MTDKWDALKIADWFEGGLGGCEMKAAAELRRLHTLTESANQDLWEICKHYGPVGELIFYKFKNRMKND
jgi:hypothetical protein